MRNSMEGTCNSVNPVDIFVQDGPPTSYKWKELYGTINGLINV